MRVQLVIPAFLTLILIAAPGRTLEKPRLLADIAPGGASDLQIQPPGDFIQAGGRLLFSTPSSSYGDEGVLWSTDGTEEGTVMISSSLCPSGCTGIRPLGMVGDVALLAPAVDTGSLRLWRSDGTAAGTYPLTGPLQILSGDAFPPQNVRGSLLFAACDDSAGCEIWRSDGTPEGTGIVKDVYPGPFGSYPRHLTAWRGRLYFLGNSDTQSGLWSTDGTAAGTRFVAPASADLDREENVLVATPSRLFFTSLESTDQLWTSDGTPEGTRLVRRFPALDCPNPHFCPESFLRYLQPVGDAVYFPASDGTQVELWASDGTPAGTRRLTDFQGRANLNPSPPWQLGDRWVFSAYAGGPVQRGVLWTAGPGFTHPAPLAGCRGGCPDVLSLFPGPIPGASPARLLFLGKTPSRGAELWVTDGTVDGTRRLSDICPGPCDAFAWGYPPQVLGSLGGRTYFLTRMANGEPGELWASDGTPAGTFRVAGSVRGIGVLGGRVYYGAVESSTLELRSTDGSPAAAGRQRAAARGGRLLPDHRDPGRSSGDDHVRRGPPAPLAQRRHPGGDRPPAAPHGGPSQGLLRSRRLLPGRGPALFRSPAHVHRAGPVGLGALADGRHTRRDPLARHRPRGDPVLPRPLLAAGLERQAPLRRRPGPRDRA